LVGTLLNFQIDTFFQWRLAWKEVNMKGDIRTTRECSISQLHPDLPQAVREYFLTHQLGDADVITRMCSETITERHNLSKLASILDGSPDTTIHLGLLLTEEWLVWARRGDISGTIVNGARLKGLQVRTMVEKRTNDYQLEITGRIGDTKDYVRGSLQLGPELAAQKFCEEVERVVNSVTPPPKKKKLNWFGMSKFHDS
jgi:hypothetical protein